MNIHRIARDVGAQYFVANFAGALHRSIASSTLTRFRRSRAEDAMLHVAVDPSTGAVAGNVRRTPCTLAWCVASGVARAASILHKTDDRIDNVFGSNMAHRTTPGRPAWETEGVVARLGELPLQGLTLLGSKVGALYGDMFKRGPRDEAAAQGARLGALVGGVIAYSWSQGCALLGFALKVALRIPVMAYTLANQSYKPLAVQLARDSGYSADYGPQPSPSLLTDDTL